MNIVITGADGFIGRNLAWHLQERGLGAVLGLVRGSSPDEWDYALAQADVVFHLAGVNRPPNPADFDIGNAQLSARVCAMLAAAGRRARLVISSSTQASMDNPYAQSKRAAEQSAFAYRDGCGAPVHVFRLPNVFGKWARPDYNSAVATFCHRIARGMSIEVNPAAPPLRLVHVDDVVEAFAACLGLEPDAVPAGQTVFEQVTPVHETTLPEIVSALHSFAECRSSLLIPPVGTGFLRALYSTYVSYLEPAAFSYPVRRHADARGEFVEMLKTRDSGQFSYFSAHPGVTRGEHYHHAKTEKFLVLRGTARFGFRHILTGERHELVTQGGEPVIVETVPGWTHDVTNVGNDEMVVMLWANEIFDPERPDTRAMKVQP